MIPFLQFHSSQQHTRLRHPSAAFLSQKRARDHLSRGASPWMSIPSVGRAAPEAPWGLVQWGWGQLLIDKLAVKQLLANKEQGCVAQ